MFFVEIGSCCFDTLISLTEKGWSGIVVEPVKEWLDQLPRLEGVAYENVAVSDVSGEEYFWFMDPEADEVNGDDILKAIGSLDKDFSEFERAESLLIKRKVKVVTPTELLGKYNVKHVDLLKVDAEGYDDRIVMSMPFDKVRFDRILFEYSHIEEKPVVELLKSLGYEIEHIDAGDMLATHKDAKSIDIDIEDYRFAFGSDGKRHQ